MDLNNINKQMNNLQIRTGILGKRSHSDRKPFDKKNGSNGSNGPIVAKRPRLSTETVKASKQATSYLELMDRTILKKICEHLDLYDLLQMYEVGNKTKQIIIEDVLPTKVIDIAKISKYYSVRNVFKKFGPFASEIIISESDIQWKSSDLSQIEEIMRLINKRCSTENLKKLTIIFDQFNKTGQNFRTISPERMTTLNCLNSLESLTIQQCCDLSENLEKCLCTIFDNCCKLNSLSIRYIKTSGSFLSKLCLMKLHNLTITCCTITNRAKWVDFMKVGISSLKSFKWQHINVPNVHRGCIFGVYNEYCDVFPSIEEISIDLEDIPSLASVVWFSKCSTLKCVHLRSSHWSDSLIGALDIMSTAYMSKVEVLNIFIRPNHTRLTNDLINKTKNVMMNFKHLKTIRIELTSNCLDWDDVISFVKEMPSITNVTLIGVRTFLLKNIEEAISISPNMHSLKLSVPIRPLTDKFYDKLVRDRIRWYRKSPQLDLHLPYDEAHNLKKTITDYDKKETCIRLC